MLSISRLLLFWLMTFSSAVCAQNKVVVVPLIGDGSTHEHPDVQHVRLTGADFRPFVSTTNYNLGVTGSELRLISPTPTLSNFVATLPIPNEVTLRSMTMIYMGTGNAGDVKVKLFASPDDVLTNGERLLAQVSSTNVAGFAKRTNDSINLIAGFNPVDTANNNYYLTVTIRTEALLRGVTVSYSTEVN